MRTLLLSLVMLSGCGGAGSVVFTTYGEEFIEDKMTGFEDGWEVTYDKFLVNLGEIQVADRKGNVAATMSAPKVFDVKKKGPVEVTRFEGLPAARWDVVGYSIAPVTAQAVAGNADAADVQLMRTSGYSVYFTATARKGAESKTLAWGFTHDTLYEECAQETLGAGVIVPVGGEDTVQLTIHGDHPWFDDLQSDDAKMRFQAFADADRAPADGVVTLDELAATPLTTLPIDQYGTAGAANVKNLRDFVQTLLRTIGHYRGEGECSPKAR